MKVYALSAAEFGNRILDVLVSPLIALMAFLALLVFIVAAIRFMYLADASGDRQGIFKRMIIIIIGLFIIFSIYTIFAFVGRLAGSPIQLRRDTVEFRQYDLVERGSSRPVSPVIRDTGI